MLETLSKRILMNSGSLWENMLSVIVPVYNVEEYLHVCLNSVIKQNYPDFEVICIDDASTDSTSEILEYFSKKDSRIKIFRNESNMGLGYSRNRGLDIAKGKYVLFIDGDDWFSLDAFNRLIPVSEENNLDILIFKSIVYYEDSSYFGMERYYDMEFMTKFDHKVFTHCDVEKRKVLSIPTPVWNKLYLKSFLDENNIRFINDNCINEDNPFTAKAIINANRISVFNEYFYNRRRRSDSLSTLTNERLFDIFKIVFLIVDAYLEDKEIYEYYKKELLNYIFGSILKRKYEVIDDEYKEEFFKGIQEVYERFIKDYGLYNDIKDNVDEDIQDFILGKDFG